MYFSESISDKFDIHFDQGWEHIGLRDQKEPIRFAVWPFLGMTSIGQASEVPSISIEKLGGMGLRCWRRVTWEIGGNPI